MLLPLSSIVSDEMLAVDLIEVFLYMIQCSLRFSRFFSLSLSLRVRTESTPLRHVCCTSVVLSLSGSPWSSLLGFPGMEPSPYE